MKHVHDEAELHTPECAAAHLTNWMVEPDWFRAAVAQVQTGAFVVNAMDPNQPSSLYSVTADGIAVIPIAGPMMKIDSKYGSTNTLRVRRAVRAAARDADVRAILLHIDSPGGTAAGTDDLATDVRRARDSKPVFAHIDDMGASAAYWVASQCEHISCNPSGEVGSIGTVAILRDESGAAEQAGIKVHVISTGRYKGAFAPGAPVPDEHLQYAQDRVDAHAAYFKAEVQRGRGLTTDQVDTLADGRLYSASVAKASGLIDSIAMLDEAVARINDRIGPAKESRRRRSRAAQRARIAAR